MSSVMPIVACPRHSLTTFGCTPCLRSWEACECSALRRLRLLEADALPGTFERSSHRQRGRFEIDVLPSERNDLASPKPCCDREQDLQIDPLLSGSPKECGRLSLVESQHLRPGLPGTVYSVCRDGEDQRGIESPAGIYFAVLRGAGTSTSQKIILLR